MFLEGKQRAVNIQILHLTKCKDQSIVLGASTKSNDNVQHFLSYNLMNIPFSEEYQLKSFKSTDSTPCHDYRVPLITNSTYFGTCNDYMVPLITKNADDFGSCSNYMLPMITNSAA